jgi:ElaB/YqjD/DUF883 family membrane-anchored ribosome-binding protein
MTGNSNFPSGTKASVENSISRIAGEAKQKAQDLADKAGDKAAAVKDRAEDTLSTVGEKMTNLAGAIREHAPQEGVIGNAASTVARNLQSGGRYLQEHDLNDMGHDVNQLVRQYPLQSLLMSFGVGCLLGMTLRR